MCNLSRKTLQMWSLVVGVIAMAAVTMDLIIMAFSLNILNTELDLIMEDVNETAKAFRVVLVIFIIVDGAFLVMCFAYFTAVFKTNRTMIWSWLSVSLVINVLSFVRLFGQIFIELPLNVFNISHAFLSLFWTMGLLLFVHQFLKVTPDHEGCVYQYEAEPRATLVFHNNNLEVQQPGETRNSECRQDDIFGSNEFIDGKTEKDGFLVVDLRNQY